jgi:hypothetical protein
VGLRRSFRIFVVIPPPNLSHYWNLLAQFQFIVLFVALVVYDLRRVLAAEMRLTSHFSLQSHFNLQVSVYSDTTRILLLLTLGRPAIILGTLHTCKSAARQICSQR